MERAITLQVDDFLGIQKEINFTYSSGTPKASNPFYVLAKALKFTFVETEEPVNTSYDNLEISSSVSEIYEKKEKEWHKLVGKKNFQSLDAELRDFLINGAGMIDLGFQIDIKKACNYPVYNDEV